MSGPVSRSTLDERSDLPPIRRALAKHLGATLTPEVAVELEVAARTPKARTLDENIRYVLRGNASAVEFFLTIRDVLHFWDDLIDRDQPITPDDIHRSLFAALVTLPSNAFYRQHQASLMPVLINAIGNWRAANVFESRDDRRELELAFVIRSDYANLLVQAAYLIGGVDWMVEVTPLIRSMWTSEGMAEYLKNLEAERTARG